MSNQKGITIVEVLVVMVILLMVFLVFLKLFTDYARRESLNQSVQILTSDINSVIEEVPISSAYDDPSLDQIECYLDETRTIRFRNNNSNYFKDNLGFKVGRNNHCLFIGKVVLFGINNPEDNIFSNVGGCSGNPCMDDLTKHSDRYKIYTLIGSNLKNDTQINFKQLDQLLVLVNDSSYNHNPIDRFEGGRPEPATYPATPPFYDFKADYPRDNNRPSEVCNNPTTIAEIKQYYCDNPKGGTDPLNDFNTIISKFIPQGSTIKASYIWNDDGNQLLDSGEAIYIDGIAIINGKFGIATNDEDGFVGGSRDIQIVGLYQPNSQASKASRDRPKVVESKGINQFIRRLENPDKEYYNPINDPIILCIAGSGGNMKIIKIGSIDGITTTLKAETDFDSENILDKCGDLPTTP